MAEQTKADQKAAEKEAKARTAALDAAKIHIEKEFGAGSLMTLSDDNALKVERSPRARSRSTWRSASAASRAAA